jgi:hypothetical protein
MEGNNLVVGSPGKAVNGHDGEGAVFVFTRNGSAWPQQAMLIDNSANGGENLGASVSINGNYIASGETGFAVIYPGNTYYNVGAVSVFVKNGASWSQQARLTSTTIVNAHLFGQTVSIYQDKLIIGAPGNNFYCIIYVRNGTVWSEFQTIDPPSYQQISFGNQVRMQNDLIMIGCPGEAVDNMSGAGNVLVYKKNASGKYQLYKRLTDNEPLYDNFFGRAIGFDGVNFIIGSPFANDERGKITFGSVTE